MLCSRKAGQKSDLVGPLRCAGPGCRLWRHHSRQRRLPQLQIRGGSCQCEDSPSPKRTNRSFCLKLRCAALKIRQSPKCGLILAESNPRLPFLAPSREPLWSVMSRARHPPFTLSVTLTSPSPARLGHTLLCQLWLQISRRLAYGHLAYTDHGVCPPCSCWRWGFGLSV